MGFRKIVIKGVGKLVLEQAELKRTNPADTLVRNQYTMISPGTELSVFLGTNQSVKEGGGPGFPVQIGYSAVGTVKEDPPADSGFRKGDLIFHPAKHCGGGYADLTSGLSVVISALTDPRQALFIRFAQIACTALRAAGCQPGERVTVFGLGLVGQMAAQLFRIGGADVLGADPKAYRRRAAEKSGIAAVDPTEERLAQSADVVIDATGVPSVINQALEACRECGQVILLGSPRGTAEVDLYRHVHVRGITIAGAHERLQRYAKRNCGGRWTRQENTLYVYNLIADGRMKTEHLITHEITPEQAQETFTSLAADAMESLGIVIRWD